MCKHVKKSPKIRSWWMSTDLPVLYSYSVVNAKLSIKANNPIQVWSGCKTVLDLSLLIIPPITPEIKFNFLTISNDTGKHRHHHRHHSDTIIWMFKAENNITLKAGIHYTTFALYFPRFTAWKS